MQGEFVIRVICMADGEPGAYDGRFLEWYNPNLSPDDSVDMGGFTPDISKAMKFPDAGAALACWNQERVIGSPRFDGRPNKPLTAFTVEVVRVEDAMR